MPGLIKWFEIPAQDFDRALKFYSSIFRREIDLFEFSGVKHGIFKVNSGISGAIVDTPDFTGKNQGPVIFFDANPDMLEMLENIENGGGEIIQTKALIKNTSSEDGESIISVTKIDDNIGYYAYFYDTEGNKMGLYSNS